jgi:selenide,water dikinase
LDRPDDAGVYRLNEEIALVQTVDFFTPIVDDPFVFGQIAAVNALSDIYAMGATPITAMNITCFPSKTMDISVLNEILRGGLDKTREAEVPIIGGHSVSDPEIKYGLSVTGVVHPDAILSKAGVEAGDHLVLTKRLGTGVVSTAVKKASVSEDLLRDVIESMRTLNREPAELARDLSVHACTDITGFGLLGHSREMIRGSGLGMRIVATDLPLFDGLEEHLAKGHYPGGLERNRKHNEKYLVMEGEIPRHYADLVCDPETSGGLLFALPARDAAILTERLRGRGLLAAMIGTVVSDKEERFTLY